MAEAILSVVLDQLTSFIRIEVAQEVQLVVGVREELQNLETKLRLVKAVLEDAEKKEIHDNAVKVWLGQLKDVMYDAEDVLDEWNTRILISANGPHVANRVRFYLLSLCACFKHLGVRHNIAHGIKGIREGLDVIALSKDQLGLVQIDDVENPSIYEAKKLRTLVAKSSTLVPCALHQLTCLRTLDLSYKYSDPGLEVLPSEVSRLLHLRYLNLSFNTRLKELPETVRSLVNLQILKLNQCYDLCKLPEGIGELSNLRHLEVESTGNLKYYPRGGIERLSQLRTLSKFVVSDGSIKGSGIEELGNLNFLKGRLCIMGLRHVKSVNEAKQAELQKKKNISTLMLNFGYELYRPYIGHVSSEEEILRMEGSFARWNCVYLKIDEGPFEFKMDEEQVIDGLDRAVMTMKKGEAGNFIEYDTNFSEEEKKQSKVLKVSCNLNNAACKLKLKDYKQAEKLCSKTSPRLHSAVLVIAESADNCLKMMLRNCKVVRVLPQIADCAKKLIEIPNQPRHRHHFHRHHLLTTPSCLPQPPPKPKRKPVVPDYGCGSIDSARQKSSNECEKSTIIKCVSIPARDLRILGPVFSQSSNILAREKAMVVNLEFIKAIVTAEEVLLLDPLCQEVLPFIDQLRQQLLHKNQPKNNEDCQIDGKELVSSTGGQWLPVPEAADGLQCELPFEFQVLEITLEVVCTFLDSSVADLERDAYPVLDELSRNVSTKNLELVRSLKSNLTCLLARVQKFEALMGPAASNTIVSAAPNLRRLSSNMSASLIASNHSDDNDVEDLEMLLEAYFMQLDGTRNKILLMREYIDDTEDNVNIQLDNQRNELIQLQLTLTIASFAIAAETLIAGIFCMNIPCELFEINGVFGPFVDVISAICFLIFLLLLGYARWKKLLSS
ncbi:hypothetical protein IFM89_038863 [Coptis chinensis]|uniref:Rx N-terminal domain-containing protein n=1 Tax=Coptis chinensis TaxID=261450 RepID=A0A835LXW1_9MAGN|nr:hypothetical protein IFM89_038863 [Coptis chinensis]